MGSEGGGRKLRNFPQPPPSPPIANVACDLPLEGEGVGSIVSVRAGANALISFNLRHFKHAAPKFGLHLSQPGPFLRDFLRGIPS
jgi:hypothetical protein